MPPDPLAKSPPLTPVGAFRRRDTGRVTNLLQPDYSYTQDQYGLLQGTISKMMDSTSPGGAAVPNKGSPHPMDSRMGAYKSSISFTRNGKAVVTTDYIGILSDPTKPEWDVSSNTAETSILFHPRIAEFAVLKGGTGPNPIDSVTWKTWVECEPNSNKFKQFAIGAPGDLAGVSKYLIPRASVKYSFYTKRVDTVHKFMANLSTWSAKPQNGPIEIFPQGKANYLLQSCNVTPFGIIYKISCEWQLSEHGKPWNKEVYPAFNSQSSGSGGYNNPNPPKPL